MFDQIPEKKLIAAGTVELFVQLVGLQLRLELVGIVGLVVGQQITGSSVKRRRTLIAEPESQLFYNKRLVGVRTLDSKKCKLQY